MTAETYTMLILLAAVGLLLLLGPDLWRWLARDDDERQRQEQRRRLRLDAIARLEDWRKEHER